ncbi:hypothetical protein AAEX28_07975 [Lentisphaerota bacterium WC36G]|nr:hypothetical protein LJT99_10830 [Lentisphaerae bacterium WC36]
MLGKILLGTVVGVGAVAAAPFTGGGSVLAGASLVASLTGAATAATTAGLAGAAIGAAVGRKEEEDIEANRRSAKKKGFEDGIKKGETEILKKMKPILKKVKEQDDYMIGLTAFCYTIAKCDGKISAEEQDELDYYLNYIVDNGTLSPVAKDKMLSLKNSTLTFKKCKKYLDKISFENLLGFSDILDSIIEADNIIHPAEIKLKEDWEKYYHERSLQS